MINRRGLITGLISFVAAPAIVRASSLMPVKAIDFMTFDDYCELILRSMRPMVDICYGKFNVRPEWLVDCIYEIKHDNS